MKKRRNLHVSLNSLTMSAQIKYLYLRRIEILTYSLFPTGTCCCTDPCTAGRVNARVSTCLHRRAGEEKKTRAVNRHPRPLSPFLPCRSFFIVLQFAAVRSGDAPRRRLALLFIPGQLVLGSSQSRAQSGRGRIGGYLRLRQSEAFTARPQRPSR